MLVVDGKFVDIEVVYGGDEGFDLCEVVRYIGLSMVEVVCCYIVFEYIVYFLGF